MPQCLKVPHTLGYKFLIQFTRSSPLFKSTFHAMVCPFLNVWQSYFLDKVWVRTTGLHIFLSLPQFLLRNICILQYQHLHSSSWTPPAKLFFLLLLNFEFNHLKQTPSVQMKPSHPLSQRWFFCPFHRNTKQFWAAQTHKGPVCGYSGTDIVTSVSASILPHPGFASSQPWSTPAILEVHKKNLQTTMQNKKPPEKIKSNKTPKRKAWGSEHPQQHNWAESLALCSSYTQPWVIAFSFWGCWKEFKPWYLDIKNRQQWIPVSITNYTKGNFWKMQSLVF